MQQIVEFFEQVIERTTPFQTFFNDFVAVIGDPRFKCLPIILLVAGSKDADKLRATGVRKVVAQGRSQMF